MLEEYLIDAALVVCMAAATISIALAFRVQGAAALGVAMAAITVVFIQANGAGLAAIGLTRPPDVAALAPWVLGGLTVCYSIAALTSYLLARRDLAPNVSRLDFVKGNLPALAIMLTASWTTAAFGEEIVFRGFLQNRASALNVDIQNWGFLVIAGQAVLFGLAHAYQGLGGIIVTGVLGLALGTLTYAAGGNLWPAILVHGLINTVSLIALYLTPPRRAHVDEF